MTELGLLTWRLAAFFRLVILQILLSLITRGTFHREKLLLRFGFRVRVRARDFAVLRIFFLALVIEPLDFTVLRIFMSLLTSFPPTSERFYSILSHLHQLEEQ